MSATVVCHGVPTGLTLTASIFPDGSDTAAQTGLTCTEATNRKTTYSFSNTGDQTGLHLIHIKSGSNVVWVGWASLAASGTIQASDDRRVAAYLDAVISELMTTQLTESYAADGVAPTLAQAIFLIQQALTEFSVSGTTLTIKKLDGTTTAATETLNDATTPTSITRAI